MKPLVWVSRLRIVTDSLPAAPNSGRYSATAVSSPTRPSSMSWTTAIDVNSFDTEAMSKIVSRRMGSHSLCGSSCVALR